MILLLTSFLDLEGSMLTYTLRCTLSRLSHCHLVNVLEALRDQIFHVLVLHCCLVADTLVLWCWLVRSNDAIMTHVVDEQAGKDEADSPEPGRLARDEVVKEAGGRLFLQLTRLLLQFLRITRKCAGRR